MIAAAMVFFVATGFSDHTLWRADSFAQENPPGSPAEDNLETRGENGERIRCREIPEARGGTLIGYIVPCITYTIEHTTAEFSREMIAWLMPTVWAFITFVITMFGVKVLQGEGEVHKQGFLLLLKLTLVIMILELIPTVAVPQLYGVMTETQQIVSNMIGGSNTELHCDIDKYGDENTVVVWKQLDCVLGKLYGFTMGTDGKPSMLLAASVFGMLGGFFFGGTFGVALFVALVGVLWTMFSLVLRTVLAFLSSYLYASLMLLIAPIFLPLVLLKVTDTYFNKWWSSILACILLPVIITSYVMFAMMVYDKILLKPGSDLEVLFQYDQVKDGQRNAKQLCSKPVTGNPQGRSDISGIAQTILYNNPFLKNIPIPGLSAGNDRCASMMFPELDVTKMAGGKYETAKDGFTEMFKQAVKILVLTMLVNVGFQNVMAYAKMFIGSYAVGGSLSAVTAQEKKMEAALQSAEAGAIAGFENKSRSEFISRIPAALQTAALGNREAGGQADGFFGALGVSRKSE